LIDGDSRIKKDDMAMLLRACAGFDSEKSALAQAVCDRG